MTADQVRDDLDTLRAAGLLLTPQAIDSEHGTCTDAHRAA
jgi:hypothetical protein